MNKVTPEELEKIINEVVHIILHEDSCGETSIPNKVYVEIHNEPRDGNEEEIAVPFPTRILDTSPQPTKYPDIPTIDVELYRVPTQNVVTDDKQILQVAIKDIQEGLMSPHHDFSIPEEPHNNPFPPQDRTKYFTQEPLDLKYRTASYGFIGTWKMKDAKKIAKQLRKDGFGVWLRGRGTRLVNGCKHSRVYQGHLPQKFATHGSIYIQMGKVTAFSTIEGGT